MKTRSKYFLGLIIILISLAIFAIFSIIFCVVNGDKIPEAKSIEHTLAFGYMFIHLIIVLIALYFALKSYFVKDSILSIFMTLENGKKNQRAYRNTLLFAVIFGIFGIFFFLNAFAVLHIMKFFSLGLNIALTNVNLSISAVALYLYFYKPVEKEEN